MARARLIESILIPESVTDPDLRVRGTQAVTVLEIDGTTPFAGTMWNAASGGTEVPSPQTTSLGLLELYTAPANARPVKLSFTYTVGGVPRTTVLDGAFRLDESDVMSLSTAQTVTGTKLNMSLDHPTIIVPSIDWGALTTAVTRQRPVIAYDYGVGRGSLSDPNYDDTENANEIVERVREQSGFNNPGAGATVVWPPVRMPVSSLDWTWLQGVTMIGTHGATLFVGCRQTGTAYPVIDMMGSSTTPLDGIGAWAAMPDLSTDPATVGRTRPSCLIAMMADDNGTASPTIGDDRNPNATLCRNIWGGGFVGVTGLYLGGCSDMMFEFLHIGLENSPGKSQVIVTGKNNYGVVSAYRPDAPMAIQDSQNIDFAYIGGRYIIIKDSTHITFHGGSIDGSVMPCCVELQGDYVHHLAFKNTQFTWGYGSENQVPSRETLIYVTAASVNSMSFDGPYPQNALKLATVGPTVPAVSFMKAETGTVFSGLKIGGMSGPGNDKDVYAAGIVVLDIADHSPTTTVTLQGGEIDAAGGDIKAGGSVDSVRLPNVGTLTLPTGATWSNREGGASAEAALTTGMFGSLSSSWGSTATVSAVTGTARCGTFTITSAGTGQGNDPTVILTHPMKYGSNPQVFAQLVGGTGASAALAAGTGVTSNSNSTTTCTFQLPGLTVVNGSTYQVRFRVES